MHIIFVVFPSLIDVLIKPSMEIERDRQLYDFFVRVGSDRVVDGLTDTQPI